MSDQYAQEEQPLVDFEAFNSREPTRPDDLPVITATFRTMESLEQRAARETLSGGRAVRMCLGFKGPVVLCTSMAQVVSAQKAARKRGWK